MKAEGCSVPAVQGVKGHCHHLLVTMRMAVTLVWQFAVLLQIYRVLVSKSLGPRSPKVLSVASSHAADSRHAGDSISG